MPQVLQIIKNLATVDHEKAGKGFDLLDELCEYCLTVIAPYVKSQVELCILIGNDASINEELKAKAILFLGSLIKNKKKAILKNKLVEPIVGKLSR